MATELRTPDRELLLRLRARDRDAWTALYTEHQPRLRAFGYRLAGNAHDADDLVQETFVRAVPRLDELDPDTADVQAYLFATLRNLFLKQVERGKRTQPVAEVPEPIAPTPIEDDPERATLLAAQVREMRVANSRLDARQRLVLALRELEERSYAEIGEIVGLNENAVAQLIFRARESLRIELRLAQVDPDSMPEECRAFLPLLAQHLDGELKGKRGARAIAHLESCERCQSALADMREASRRYRTLFPPLLGAGYEDARAATDERLEETGYWKHGAARRGGAGRGVVRRLRRRGRIAAAAAGLVVLAGGGSAVAVALADREERDAAATVPTITATTTPTPTTTTVRSPAPRPAPPRRAPRPALAGPKPTPPPSPKPEPTSKPATVTTTGETDPAATVAAAAPPPAPKAPTAVAPKAPGPAEPVAPGTPRKPVPTPTPTPPPKAPSPKAPSPKAPKPPRKPGVTRPPLVATATPDTTMPTPDTIAPTIQFTSAPAASTPSADAGVSFTASEPDVTFACRVDGAPAAPCTSPVSLTALAPGAHSVAVRATDAAGNVGPEAVVAWSYVPPDTTAPTVTIGTRPPASTTDTSASFGFTADEAGVVFACSLDGAPLAACASPAAYSGLAVGLHQFSVRATDAAGNVGATVTAAWTVAAPLPDLRVSSLTKSSVTVTNGGAAAATAPSVLTVSLVGTFTVPALAPGASATFTWSICRVGTYSAIADRTGVVAESDETNNTAALANTCP